MVPLTRARWATAGVATLLLALAGCTSSASGVDGELGDDWGVLPQAQVFAPDAGVCHEKSYEKTGRASAYTPIDCAEPHYGETVHLGQFTGAAGDLATPPDAAGSEVAKAYAECDKQATSYVGQQWRNGRITLDLTVPSSAAWRGGARWFRCELNELTTVTDKADWVRRKGSLKGGLPDDLLLGCFSEKGANGTVDKMTEAECATTHNAEYVGSFAAADDKTYPAAKTDWDYFHDNCRVVMAEYVAVTSSVAKNYGVISWPYSQAAWTTGDRGVRCFLWLDGKSMAGSAKGTTGKGVPS